MCDCNPYIVCSEYNVVNSILSVFRLLLVSVTKSATITLIIHLIHPGLSAGKCKVTSVPRKGLVGGTVCIESDMHSIMVSRAKDVMYTANQIWKIKLEFCYFIENG